jgi:hypothetical protein
MAKRLFSAPVMVWTKAGLRRSVTGVDEAAEVLLYDVPKISQNDRIVRSAMRACHDALTGNGETENARTIFEAAAREVGILVN